MCRARLGKGKPWHPMTLEEVHKRFPLFLSERALPAEDADALLRELLVEGQTWTQDEWWIAGEARKAPRLTAVYEMTPGGGDARLAASRCRLVHRSEPRRFSGLAGDPPLVLGPGLALH